MPAGTENRQRAQQKLQTKYKPPMPGGAESSPPQEPLKGRWPVGMS